MGLFDGPPVTDAQRELVAMTDARTREWYLQAEIETLYMRIAELQDAFREIYEVYAGSNGFIPETCAEGYQQQLIKEMSEIAARHMRKGK
jgi:hypothetical protein